MQQEKGEENQKTTLCKSNTGIQNPGFKRRDFNKKKKIGARDLGEMKEREKNLNFFFKKCSSWDVLRE